MPESRIQTKTKNITTTPRCKRLIEVAFPLEEVSAHLKWEKNVRQGHISTLHIGWAMRPLAARRAFIYGSLVYAPRAARRLLHGVTE